MSKKIQNFLFSAIGVTCVVAPLLTYQILYRQSSIHSSLKKTHFPTFEDLACQQIYLDLYKNPHLDIRVIFGYKDARPARFVADRYEELGLIQKLLRSCQTEDDALCEFEPDHEDLDLFQKTILGPDGTPKTISIQVIHSSVGPDDEENRQNPFQNWQSDHAKRKFLDGLKSADIVFYNGHSRGGGGPDFSPPRLRKNSHIAYDWYRNTQTGLKEILEVFNHSKSSIKLLGLFSCASSKLFSQQILQARNDLGLISSEQLLYFADAQESLFQALSAIIGMKCQSEWNKIRKSQIIQIDQFFNPTQH